MGAAMDASLNQNTYALLKADIMTLKLLPGEVISAAKIAERYNVSRTPAREAIVKLDQEGLVEIFPQSRTVVSKINLDRAKQEWFIRSSLEINMVPIFIRHCTEETISRLSENLEQQKRAQHPINAGDYLKLDNEFHGIIYEAAGEMLAKEIIDTHITHYNRIRYLTDFSPEIRFKTIHEHEQIIKAAEEKDGEWMEAVLRKHIRRILTDQESLLTSYPDYFEEKD